MSISAVKSAGRHADILTEVLAGMLWMHLSVPADASSDELKACALDLLRAAEYGAGEAAIEQSLKRLQSEQFARPVNSLTIKLLARRVLEAVRRNSAMPAGDLRRTA